MIAMYLSTVAIVDPLFAWSLGLGHFKMGLGPFKYIGTGPRTGLLWAATWPRFLSTLLSCTVSHIVWSIAAVSEEGLSKGKRLLLLLLCT